MKNELRSFFLLWGTQSVSQLGSSMTGFALTLWLYEQTGSALETAMLAICSYAPYVLMSIFAGALSDRWDKKKTMLICDVFAALSTVCVLILVATGSLRPWHLYAVNAFSGLMNTVQQPAADVAQSLLVPPRHYQRVSGLRSFSGSVVTILNPVIATAVYSVFGIFAVLFFDLFTCILASLTLLLAINVPKPASAGAQKKPVLASAKMGLAFLRQNPLLLWLILFLAAVNLVASAFDAALAPFVLSSPAGSQRILGYVSACAGIGTLVGSLAATFLPKPGNRVRVITLTMLFSLSVENFILAFSPEPWAWCAAQFIGWSVVPIMNANLDVVLRLSIPIALQGRVYACRNTLQFFTIPLGLFLGGVLVDGVCNPIMEAARPDSILAALFGGSGGAMVMFLLGLAGTAVCLIFDIVLRRYRFEELAEM